MPKLATQQFLDAEQIREGVIVLKNKSLRVVMMVSSLNFALKSDEEQQAIIYQFQNFLNSLDFSCQILVQSRRLNITGYLDKLKEFEKKQPNELLQVQTTEYRKFIESLVTAGTIMTKSFFVVIPYYGIFEERVRAGKKLFQRRAPKVSTLTEEAFQRGKQQLWQRMEFVALGLRRCGLQAIPLTTPEIIELFWGLYHPKEGEFGYYPEIPPELTK
jgi:type IV secretory pathway VirB4 component